MSKILKIILLAVMLTIISVSILVWVVTSSTAAGYYVPSVQLIDGKKIPMIGLGTFKIKDEETAKRITEEAIEVGYRHIDTAYHYGNEVFIGEKLRQLISNNNITRKDIFLTSKLWNTFHSRPKVIEGLKLSLKDLGLEYLDLALIHFPMGFKEGTGQFIPTHPNGSTIDSNITVVETWKGMEDAYKLGLAKSIGVSNFNEEQLGRILRECQMKPVVNQIEVHPYLTQVKLVDYCKSNNIEVVAYSPLAKADPNLLNEPILKQISLRHNKTIAQVILRWLIQRDLIVIPKTTKKERLIENFKIFDFQLSDDEMREIFKLNKNKRITTYSNAINNPEYPFEKPLNNR